MIVMEKHELQELVDLLGLLSGRRGKPNPKPEEVEAAKRRAAEFHDALGLAVNIGLQVRT